MASTRVEDHQLLSCKFSPKLDNVLSCTTSTTEDPYGPGALNIYKHTEGSKLELLNSIAWKHALLDTCWSKAQHDIIVTASTDGNLDLWRIFSSEWMPTITLGGHTQPATSVQWLTDFNANNTVLSGSLDGESKIWDVGRKSVIWSKAFNDGVLQANSNPFLPHIIVVVLESRKMAVLDSRTGSGSCQTLAMNDQVLSCDWSPHIPTRLATSSSLGNISSLDIRFLTRDINNSNSNNDVTMHCHNGPARRVRWLPGFSDVVVSVGFDGITALTDLSKRVILEKVRHHSNFVYDVDCSPFHYNVLVDCSWDSLLHVFEPRSLINRKVTLPLLNKL